MSRVYVGIVTYNSLADLPRCLAGLTTQTHSDVRVTILDNASTDGTLAWLQSHAPHIPVLLNTHNVGFARAHNRLIAFCAPAPDEFYMPLNPDVELTSDYILSLVALLQQTGAGWGIGKLRLLDETGQRLSVLYSVGHGLRRGGYAFNIGYLLPDEGQFDATREVFGAPGASPLLSGKLLADVALGGEVFDADMFMYGEDTDFDWRARRLGWQCWYTPAAVAYHRGSQVCGVKRAEALAHRYLSVIKNAWLIDLLLYNLPLMLAHCALRLLLTPHEGMRISQHLLGQGPRMWRKRQKPMITREVMNGWFRWSAMQPTAQPVTWWARLIAFLKAKRLRQARD